MLDENSLELRELESSLARRGLHDFEPWIVYGRPDIAGQKPD
jgi:hypothetical protein